MAADGHTDHEYLGDGVYASFDGYQIWLRVGHHQAPPAVALEPQVLHALNNYAMTLMAKYRQKKETPDGT
jgi:hypothetical protein